MINGYYDICYSEDEDIWYWQAYNSAGIDIIETNDNFKSAQEAETNVIETLNQIGYTPILVNIIH